VGKDSVQGVAHRLYEKAFALLEERGVFDCSLSLLRECDMFGEFLQDTVDVEAML
jgi:hypothetical protein